jgi:hypothetical protein
MLVRVTFDRIKVTYFSSDIWGSGKIRPETKNKLSKYFYYTSLNFCSILYSLFHQFVRVEYRFQRPLGSSKNWLNLKNQTTISKFNLPKLMKHTADVKV